MTDNEKKVVELIKSQNEQIKQLKAKIEAGGKEKELPKSEEDKARDFSKEIDELKNQLHTLANKPKDNEKEFDNILDAMKKA